MLAIASFVPQSGAAERRSIAQTGSFSHPRIRGPLRRGSIRAIHDRFRDSPSALAAAIRKSARSWVSRRARPSPSVNPQTRQGSTPLRAPPARRDHQACRAAPLRKPGPANCPRAMAASCRTCQFSSDSADNEIIEDKSFVELRNGCYRDLSNGRALRREAQSAKRAGDPDFGSAPGRSLLAAAPRSPRPLNCESEPSTASGARRSRKATARQRARVSAAGCQRPSIRCFTAAGLRNDRRTSLAEQTDFDIRVRRRLQQGPEPLRDRFRSPISSMASLRMASSGCSEYVTGSSVGRGFPPSKLSARSGRFAAFVRHQGRCSS